MRTVVLGSLLLGLCPAVVRGGSGLVALQTADPSCGDSSGAVYVDCGNGTVTDNRTGLVWLANADCIGSVSWADAMDFAAGLSDVSTATCTALGLTQVPCDCGLHDHSSPGEWRLPTASEWTAMVADALGVGGDPDCTGVNFPTITNDSGTDCWINGPSSFTDVWGGVYWSSTVIAGSVSNVGEISLATGVASYGLKSGGASLHAWPVRGGQ